MKLLYAIAVTAFLLAACSTTRITSTWTAKNPEPKAYKKILVLGLINERDRTVREQMEEHLVGDLKSLGYTAICSCDEFGPKAFENLTEKQALAKLSDKGIDAVLTIVLLDKQKERYYVPDRVNYSPYGIYHDRFWGYYTVIHGRIYSPGYYVTDTKYFWESNFYTLENSPQLLYSAQSRSFDPSSTSSLSHEYGQMIVKDMLKKNVIADQKNAGKPLASN